MNNGISLHIGINNLSSHYNGSGFANLTLSIANARKIRKIASPYFLGTISPYFAPNALFADGNYTLPTVDNVRNYVKNAACILQEGDIFLLTYSGHGSRIKFPDTPANENGFDETWCLYDREFFDDEILEMFSYFRKGVRILFISDSCHSGTIISKRLLIDYLDKISEKDQSFDYENFDIGMLLDLGASISLLKKFNSERFKEDIRILKSLKLSYTNLLIELLSLPRESALPKVIGDSVYERNKKYYNDLMRETRKRLRRRMPKTCDTDFKKLIDASVIQISACSDDETISEGVFSQALVDVWNKEKPTDYNDFYGKIRDKSEKTYWEIIGNDSDLNKFFEAQKPFTVESS